LSRKNHFNAYCDDNLFWLLRKYKKKPFSDSIVFFGLNNSLNVYIYANNAIKMQLPLSSGLAGAEGGFHG